MPKISSIATVPVPKLSDKLVGTSVGGTPNNQTNNFTLQQLKTLFDGSTPLAATLQSVLNAGNTATQNIFLTGRIEATNLDISNDSNLTNIYLSDRFYDRNNSQGTSGQYLTSTGTGVQWSTLTIGIPTLQQVLTAGNVSDRNITTTGNLQANNITGTNLIANSNLRILGTLADSSNLVGTSGQVLSSTVSGTSWVNLPSYSAVSPLLYNSVLNQFSIQQATSSQNGYLSSSDWLTFDGKQNAGNYITQLTGEASASGPGSATITLNNLAVINKTLTGLTVSGGTISSSDSILTAFGKLQNQINSVVTGLDYQGTWNASLNIPNLVSGIGTNGDYYVVDVAGNTNLDGITDWNVGDWAIFNGNIWQKLDNSESVSSVNGQTGAVVLTTTNINEGTNLYFTQGRVSANADVSANTFARHNAVTLGTANGLSLATQQLSLGLASSSTTGALSSTDWNTFNSRVGGTIATGQVAFGTATNTVGGDSGLVWNNTVKRLELLGTDNSTIRLRGNTAGAGYFVTQINSNSTAIALGNSGVITGTGTSNILWSNTDLDIFISNTQRARFFSANGNLLLQSGGTFTDSGFRLDVNGTARVQGVLTTTADAVVNGVSVGRGGGSIDGNTRVGSAALNANTTGSENAAFGVNALLLNTTATNNTGIGGSALQNNTTGGGNTAIGRSAGRFIADGTTANTISSSSVFIGFDSRANASSQTNQIVIGSPSIGLGSNTTVIGNSSTTFGRWFGNLLVGSSTNSGQVLQVTGTSLLNGLSTIQGTTASDSGQLGTELLTTGTGDASWTGTDFATGYTHVAGSTTTLTSTLAGVVNTFYQITYTVTGRTAGSFVIDFGGFTSPALTASNTIGPRATTTGTLVITPTSDFNGTIVLSIRVITASSASVTFNSSAGTATNQIRISSLDSNTFIGFNAGRTNTTGTNNSFYGRDCGVNNTTGGGNSFFGRGAGNVNTTGGSNSFFGFGSGVANITGGSNAFFGASAGAANTIGANNSFFGTLAGQNNTTASSNSFFGVSSGTSNTTGASNSFFGAASGSLNTTGASNAFIGVNSGLNNTTGSNNAFLGTNSGRRIANGTNLTIANNSVFVGDDTRAAADNQTNQIVIGHAAIGLGSNTTVLGNTSTTFGRWFGNLLIGTSTNNGTNLRVVGTTQSDIITQNLASHGRKVLQYTSVSSTTINLPTEFPLMTGLVVANAYAVFGKFLGKYITYGQAIEFYISKNPNGTWNTVAYSDSSQFIASLVSVTGSGNDLTITTQTDTSFILELTVMTQS